MNCPGQSRIDCSLIVALLGVRRTVNPFEILILLWTGEKETLEYKTEGEGVEGRTIDRMTGRCGSLKISNKREKNGGKKGNLRLRMKVK